ncbi:hypothetical protein VTL71DRAFT_11713 [Oculimacula yallundae]|uniref:NADP-dependent oxidoreductase domain-containing protein n=1 Tax=Oculimacula yallundae TaxID=86028 RepID=A0ABR4CR81_9HELO
MEAPSIASVTLSSGFCMPLIGLGTSFSTTSDAPDPVEVENTVKLALEIGYRHVDCAPVYQNEVAVGRGIKASGIPRKELFITSKLWNTEHDPKDVGPALDQTLRDLGTDYVDLYLIHWPQSYVKQVPYTLFPEDRNGDPIIVDIPLASTWEAMETLVAAGKARSIGVSNFFQPQLEEILQTAKIHPAVNQIPATPYRPKTERVEWCKSKNIHITAWGPLTIDRATQYNVASDPVAQKIAGSVNLTPAQLILSWAVQRGTSVIPKSSHKDRLQSNLARTYRMDTTFAILLHFQLGSVLAHLDASLKIAQAPLLSLENIVGAPPKEAYGKDCAYDFIADAFVPRACFDAELEYEFLKLKEWHFYGDENGQPELSIASIKTDGGTDLSSFSWSITGYIAHIRGGSCIIRLRTRTKRSISRKKKETKIEANNNVPSGKTEKNFSKRVLEGLAASSPSLPRVSISEM